MSNVQSINQNLYSAPSRSLLRCAPDPGQFSFNVEFAFLMTRKHFWKHFGSGWRPLLQVRQPRQLLFIYVALLIFSLFRFVALLNRSLRISCQFRVVIVIWLNICLCRCFCVCFSFPFYIILLKVKVNKKPFRGVKFHFSVTSNKSL